MASPDPERKGRVGLQHVDRKFGDGCVGMRMDGIVLLLVLSAPSTPLFHERDSLDRVRTFLFLFLLCQCEPFVPTMFQLPLCATDTEKELISVERATEYTNVAPEEPNGTFGLAPVPKHWPSQPTIVIRMCFVFDVCYGYVCPLNRNLR